MKQRWWETDIMTVQALKLAISPSEEWRLSQPGLYHTVRERTEGKWNKKNTWCTPINSVLNTNTAVIYFQLHHFLSLVTNFSPKVGIKCSYLNRKLISDVDEPHAPLKAAITSSISTIRSSGPAIVLVRRLVGLGLALYPTDCGAPVLRTKGPCASQNSHLVASGQGETRPRALPRNQTWMALAVSKAV